MNVQAKIFYMIQVKCLDLGLQLMIIFIVD